MSCFGRIVTLARTFQNLPTELFEENSNHQQDSTPTEIFVRAQRISRCMYDVRTSPSLLTDSTSLSRPKNSLNSPKPALKTKDIRLAEIIVVSGRSGTVRAIRTSVFRSCSSSVRTSWDPEDLVQELGGCRYYRCMLEVLSPNAAATMITMFTWYE
jgi:hypothetical protein